MQNDLSALAHAANQKVGNPFSSPFTPALLHRHPRGNIGIDGSFCEYSLFQRDDQTLLAIYFGHRMSNETYMEFDLAGEITFCRSSWGGMPPESGYPPDYLAKWEETCRRASQAGISTILE